MKEPEGKDRKSHTENESEGGLMEGCEGRKKNGDRETNKGMTKIRKQKQKQMGTQEEKVGRQGVEDDSKRQGR